MEASLSLSLPEQAVLAILSQQPAHGFAVVQLTAPGGELGRIWHTPRRSSTVPSAGSLTPG